MYERGASARVVGVGATTQSVLRDCTRIRPSGQARLRRQVYFNLGDETRDVTLICLMHADFQDRNEKCLSLLITHL
jgi:hypothetical protein